MRVIHQKLDYLKEISLKENINQRRREDIGRLPLLLLLDQPLPIHTRKVEDQRCQSILIKEEDDRRRPLLPRLLHNQIMIMVDTKD